MEKVAALSAERSETFPSGALELHPAPPCLCWRVLGPFDLAGMRCRRWRRVERVGRKARHFALGASNDFARPARDWRFGRSIAFEARRPWYAAFINPLVQLAGPEGGSPRDRDRDKRRQSLFSVPPRNASPTSHAGEPSNKAGVHLEHRRAVRCALRALSEWTNANVRRRTGLDREQIGDELPPDLTPPANGHGLP